MGKWMLRQTDVEINKIITQLNINPIVAHVLAVRGFNNAAGMKAFLSCGTQQLPSPFLFKDMLKAVNVIADAIQTQKLIAIFGDYDADGISSTVILYHAIRQLGGQVIYYIPQREAEGYGLNIEAITLLAAKKVDVLLACDNGIAAVQQVAYAKSLQMEVVIIDHHDVPLDEKMTEVVPVDAVIVNPKQKQCDYPFKMYCAAGLSYRFVEALYQHLGQDWSLIEDELLVFATIGTVCDIVDLLDDNRQIVKRGLPQITQSANLGLQALLKATGIQDKKINVYHLGFIIGPCINASGRLATAQVAVELFLTDNPEEAAEKAAYLVELNAARKNLTNEGIQEIVAIINQEQLYNDKIIIVHSAQIHESIAGIVAGRIKELYYKPTIVLTGSGELLKGSGRSINNYNLFLGLTACHYLLEKFGGHPMAAGLTLKAENLYLLRQAMNEQCLLMAEEMQPIIRIDKQVNLYNAQNMALAEDLQQLFPFGKGNPTPLFADKNIEVSKISLFGKDGQVVKLNCSTARKNKQLQLVGFNEKDKLEQLITENYSQDKWDDLLLGHASVMMDFVYEITINEYNNNKYVQLQIADFRLSN